MVTAIEVIFPRLVGRDYKITSPKDDDYNCIACALGIIDDWWWPDESGKGHWPVDVPREATVEAFQAAFATLGFAACPDALLEAGCEKVALFAIGQKPKHAARQLSNGRWTSKLGKMEDIEHDLRDLESAAYGSVVVIMKRAVRAA